MAGGASCHISTQGDLYKEFHLDEPWDSEHNKKLIEKMPPALASPHLGDAPAGQGNDQLPRAADEAAAGRVARCRPTTQRSRSSMAKTR